MKIYVLISFLLCIACESKKSLKSEEVAPLSSPLYLKDVDDLMRVGMTLEELQVLFGDRYYIDKSGSEWVVDYIFKEYSEDLQPEEVIGLSVYLVDQKVTEWAPEMFAGRRK